MQATSLSKPMKKGSPVLLMLENQEASLKVKRALLCLSQRCIHECAVMLLSPLTEIYC
ncbi:uncharacterized protein J3R85_012667 [Psidium guajava]|nr:uncharacterized protein J3R85_012667 [Psidium guajava]